MEQSRRWLVISYFSGIDSLACSHHVDDRIQWLQKEGMDPILLSSFCAPAACPVSQIRVPSISPSGLRFEMRYWMRRSISNNLLRKIAQLPQLLCLLPGHALEGLLLKYESTWSWSLLAGRRAASVAKCLGVAVIYSTGGPPSAHLAAAYCARMSGLPWIAEFQDPIVGPWIVRSKRQQAYDLNIEQLAAREAGAVVFMTERALNEAQRRNPRMRGTFIYPGADPDAFRGFRPSSPPSDKLIIGHFGSLGGTRNTEAFLAALSSLINHYPEAVQDIELRLVGASDRAQRIGLARFAFPSMVKCVEKLPRSETLKAMSECSMLLVIQNASSDAAVTIPSKTYEYLHAGLPVLGLTWDNPELEGMLVRLGHFAVDMGAASPLYQMLEQIYLGWKHNRGIAAEIQPSPYTAKAAVERLMEIAQNVSGQQ